MVFIIHKCKKDACACSSIKLTSNNLIDNYIIEKNILIIQMLFRYLDICAGQYKYLQVSIS